MLKATFVIPDFMSREEITRLVNCCELNISDLDKQPNGEWHLIVADKNWFAIDVLSRNLGYGPDCVETDVNRSV